MNWFDVATAAFFLIVGFYIYRKKSNSIENGER